MKLIQVISVLTSIFVSQVSNGNILKTPMIVQGLSSEDSFVVFEKMKSMKRIRETTGAGRELEHRIFRSSDKALTMHCVAFVSPSGGSYLAQDCKVIIKPNLSKTEITSISTIAEGKGTLVNFNEPNDNETLFTKFLATEPAFYSEETIQVKINNEIKTVPLFALQCIEGIALTCNLSLFNREKD